MRKDVKVGDTITTSANPTQEIVQGFQEVKPMVFAGIFPVDTDDFEELRDCMEKLQLNDASLTFEPETSQALGFGFRCGFLGMLHMEIIQERLEREFNQTVITTVPNVSFHAYTTRDKDKTIIVNNPSEMPDPSSIDRIEEPFIRAQIITLPDYIGNIMSLCLGKRGILINQHYLTPTRVELIFEMPLTEIVFDFYDKLKIMTRGYASFDYHPLDYRESDIAKMDILLNGDTGGCPERTDTPQPRSGFWPQAVRKAERPAAEATVRDSHTGGYRRQDHSPRNHHRHAQRCDREMLWW